MTEPRSSASTSPSTPAKQRAGVPVKVVVALVLLVLAVIFLALNTQQTRINYAFGHADAPLWIIFLILLAVGFVAGVLVSFRRSHHHRS